MAKSIMEELQISESSEKVSATPPSKLGLIAAATTGGLAVGLLAICGPFVVPAFRRICLPYVPATDTQIKNVITALNGRNCRNFIDLGSGDGRIVTSLAHKFTAGNSFTGIELNPWLVLYSKFDKTRQFGFGRKNISFLRKNIWRYPLNKHDTVVVFGVECMMDELRLKCEKELNKGTTVVACRFPFEAWSPSKIVGEGVDTVWLYER